MTNDAREKQWWVTDLAARTSTAIATPGNCGATRWYDATSVVASCMTRRGSQLTRIGLDGTVTALGIRHTEKTRAEGPPIFNDDDVRVVQGKRWFESYGGCGGGLLTRQTAAGKVRIVRVPGLEGALSLIGTRGDDLLIAHGQDDCTSDKARAVLGLFDPVDQDRTWCYELRKREQWREVRTATEVLAWAY